MIKMTIENRRNEGRTGQIRLSKKIIFLYNLKMCDVLIHSRCLVKMMMLSQDGMRSYKEIQPFSLEEFCLQDLLCNFLLQIIKHFNLGNQINIFQELAKAPKVRTRSEEVKSSFKLMKYTICVKAHILEICNKHYFFYSVKNQQTH